MKKALYIIGIVVCVFGALLSISQFVMAIIFGELGRVLLYFILVAVCAEFAVLAIMKLFKSQ